MRINVIPVSYLTDVHLMAEYREILMAPHYFKKSFNSKKGIDFNAIPKSYTLNSGHATFFYNKFGYIIKRHEELEQEMISRGFKIRSKNALEPLLKDIPKELFNNYVPTNADYKVNIERILDKIFQKFRDNKPKFYKLKGNTKSILEWMLFYNSLVKEVVLKD